MSKIFLLLFVLITSLNLQAQEIPDDVNTIIVTVKVSGSFMDHNLNMKIVGEILDTTTIKLIRKFGDPIFSGNVIDMEAKYTSSSFRDAFCELDRLAKKIQCAEKKYLFEKEIE